MRLCGERNKHVEGAASRCVDVNVIIHTGGCNMLSGCFSSAGTQTEVRVIEKTSMGLLDAEGNVKIVLKQDSTDWA